MAGATVKNLKEQEALPDEMIEGVSSDIAELLASDTGGQILDALRRAHTGGGKRTEASASFSLAFVYKPASSRRSAQLECSLKPRVRVPLEPIHYAVSLSPQGVLDFAGKREDEDPED